MSMIIHEAAGSGGHVGIITLQRPKALNALNLEMTQMLLNALIQWQFDPNIKAVIIKSSGGRAFCAGGDIRDFYLNRDATLSMLRKFFWCEYRLNAFLYQFTKPYIAFLDGITMGGGAGISIHGSHPIATENLTFAMPETGIGLFPDVGMSYWLSRLENHLGRYLGLTGQTIQADDALHIGLVKNIVASSALIELETTIIETPFEPTDHQLIDEMIQYYQIEPKVGVIFPLKKELEKVFAHQTVEDIIAASRQAPEGIKTLCELLATRSPTSLKITLAHLQHSASLTFNEVIKQDYQLVAHFLENHDFYEGVRAAIIDKDQKPKWQPAELSQVTQECVEDYFSNIGDDLTLINTYF